MAIDKQTMVVGAGAGIGVVVPWVLKEYVDTSYPSPLVGTLGTWGKWSAFLPIVTGVAALVPSFTKILNKKRSIKIMLFGYGITSLLSGIFNGMAPVAMGLSRPVVRQAAVRPAVRQVATQLNNSITPTRVTTQKILA